MSEPEKIEFKPRTPAPKAPAPGPQPGEDSSSQALQEALRSSFYIVQFIMLLLVVAFICSGFFTVEPQNKAILLRLGKPVGEGDKALLGPGIHWKFPKPIDDYVLIPFSSLQHARSIAGWYAITPEMEAAGVESQAGST